MEVSSQSEGWGASRAGGVGPEKTQAAHHYEGATGQRIAAKQVRGKGQGGRGQGHTLDCVRNAPQQVHTRQEGVGPEAGGHTRCGAAVTRSKSTEG